MYKFSIKLVGLLPVMRKSSNPCPLGKSNPSPNQFCVCLRLAVVRELDGLLNPFAMLADKDRITMRWRATFIPRFARHF
jgi:hypothetical protein